MRKVIMIKDLVDIYNDWEDGFVAIAYYDTDEVLFEGDIFDIDDDLLDLVIKSWRVLDNTITLWV